jgi:hypothetical protein
MKEKSRKEEKKTSCNRIRILDSISIARVKSHRARNQL